MATGVDVWTSLEVAKLLVQITIPISLFGLGVVVDRRGKVIQQMLWRVQKNIEWKQALFDDTIADFNKLYCGFNYVGDWNELTPTEIIAAKRRVERHIKGYSPLLNGSTMSAFDELMEISFETERGRGRATRLRCNSAMYRELPNWKQDFEGMFVPQVERTRRIQFQEKYDKFMSAFFKDVGAS